MRRISEDAMQHSTVYQPTTKRKLTVEVHKQTLMKRSSMSPQVMYSNNKAIIQDTTLSLSARKDKSYKASRQIPNVEPMVKPKILNRKSKTSIAVVANLPEPSIHKMKWKKAASTATLFSKSPISTLPETEVAQTGESSKVPLGRKTDKKLLQKNINPKLLKRVPKEAPVKNKRKRSRRGQKLLNHIIVPKNGPKKTPTKQKISLGAIKPMVKPKSGGSNEPKSFKQQFGNRNKTNYTWVLFCVVVVVVIIGVSYYIIQDNLLTS